MNLDELSILLGQFGPYQRQKYFLMCLFALLSAFHALNMVFVGAEPEHWCSLDHLNLSATPLANISQSEAKGLFIPEDEQCLQYDADERLTQLEIAIFNLSDFMASDTAGNLTKTSCSNGHSYATDEYKSTITSEVWRSFFPFSFLFLLGIALLNLVQ